MLSFNISEITIMAVKNVDYPFIIQNISKSEAINSLEIAELENRGYIYKKIVLIFSLFKAVFCLVYIK